MQVITLIHANKVLEFMSDNPAQSTAQLRERECEIAAIAFKARVRVFGWTNWITIVVPSLLAAFAGAAVFADSEWRVLTGSAALLSALLTAIHKGRNCDAYQAECQRLAQTYDGLAARYRTLYQLDIDNAEKKLLELDATLAVVRETSVADVPDAYKLKAAAKVDSKHHRLAGAADRTDSIVNLTAPQ